MHSSRMRTARLLTISQHELPRGGVPAWGGVPARVGTPAVWGTYPGVYLLGGCTYQGYLPIFPPLPPVNRMTGRCKNITLPKLRLRAVKSEAKTKIFFDERLFFFELLMLLLSFGVNGPCVNGCVYYLPMLLKFTGTITIYLNVLVLDNNDLFTPTFMEGDTITSNHHPSAVKSSRRILFTIPSFS